NWVNALAVQADGKILVGGFFNSLAGQSRTNLGRLNADGRLDMDFNAGAIFPQGVYTVLVQSDGKIVAGGSFISLSGETRSGIGRLNSDGGIDPFFNPGANGLVDCLAMQADGKILVGGAFTMLGGK